MTQGGSPVREIRSPGSVRGAAREGRPYRDRKVLDKTSLTQSRAMVRRSSGTEAGYFGGLILGVARGDAGGSGSEFAGGRR